MKNSLSLGLILSGLLLLNVAAFAQDPDLTAEEVLKIRSLPLPICTVVISHAWIRRTGPISVSIHRT